MKNNKMTLRISVLLGFVMLIITAISSCALFNKENELADKPIIRGMIIGSIKNPNNFEFLQSLDANGVFFFSPDRWPEATTKFIKESRENKYDTFTEVSPRKEPFVKLTKVGKKKKNELLLPLCMNGKFSEEWAKFVAGISTKFHPYSLGICPDEFYWANAQLRYTCRVNPNADTPFYCTCDACVKTFKKEFNKNLPKIGRSRILKGKFEESKDFILFRYHHLAEAFKKWNKAIKTANPEQKTSMVFSAVPQYALERYPSGICWDIIGREVPVDDVIVTAFPSSFDYRGPETHYYITETVKHLAGAFPKQRFGVVINLYDCNIEGSKSSIKRKIDGEFLKIKVRPVDVYGNLISTIANDARLFFCYNDKYLKEEKKSALRNGYALIRKIQDLLDTTSIPNDVAVLYSRAGEDFYALQNSVTSLSAEKDGSEEIFKFGGWAQPANRAAYKFNTKLNQKGALGFTIQKNVIHTLTNAGVPYNLYFLDQLQMKNVENSKLLILPFPYAISTKAAGMIKKMLNEGKNVLAFSKLGEYDQNGQKYQYPELLQFFGLKTIPKKRTEVKIGKGIIVFLPEFNNKSLVDEINKLLPQKTIAVKKIKGRDIEVILRQNRQDEALLFAINWENKPAQVDAVLNCRKGDYQVKAMNILPNSEKVEEKTTLMKENKLNINLKPQEVKVYRINNK